MRDVWMNLNWNLYSFSLSVDGRIILWKSLMAPTTGGKSAPMAGVATIRICSTPGPAPWSWSKISSNIFGLIVARELCSSTSRCTTPTLICSVWFGKQDGLPEVYSGLSLQYPLSRKATISNMAINRYRYYPQCIYFSLSPKATSQMWL